LKETGSQLWALLIYCAMIMLKKIEAAVSFSLKIGNGNLVNFPIFNFHCPRSHRR
jgi:hypothetical protein